MGISKQLAWSQLYLNNCATIRRLCEKPQEQRKKVSGIESSQDKSHVQANVEWLLDCEFVRITRRSDEGLHKVLYQHLNALLNRRGAMM